ncbi:MAG: type II secretion system secretin GspD [Pseudomonadota bacterium]|mgnify:CR=1 FL=1|nr:type II secretion system secretin GspD [Pseudomonadota bacterium]
MVKLIPLLLILSFISFVESATINMKDADIREFAADIAKISNKTIILDPRVKGKVTVISDQDLDEGEAYAVFLSTLRVHGFTAIENNNVVKVMPESGGRSDYSSSVVSPDTLTTEVIRLKQASAKALAPLIKPIINKQGHITAYEATNTIILADYIGNIERVKNLLLNLDKNPGDTFELVSLQNTSSNEITRILNSSYKGSNENKRNFSIQSVDSSNSVLLRGQSGVLEQIKNVIARLDSTTPKNSNLRVIYLKYANAEDIASILKDVSENLETQGASTGSVKEKSTNISFHKETNALIISAQPDIMESLQSVIAQLDIRRAQVLVEALIVELSDNLAKDLGVQYLFSGDGENQPVAIQNFGNQNPDLISIVGSEANQDSNLSANAATSLLNIQGLAIGVGKMKDDGESFAAILNLVSQDANSNILSTPSVMTMDNEISSIIVGQEIPVTTGETLSANNSNPFRSVNRQEIGVKLEVKPQINEGNAVKMEINQEVSSVFGPITSTSTDLITNKRQIQTTVMVETGETIVLGGLIDDDVQESEKKVPVLGNIPLVGRLFKSTSTSRTKRNLIVFLRPTIVRDTDEIRSISNRKYNYFEALQNLQEEQGKVTPDMSQMKDILEQGN